MAAKPQRPIPAATFSRNFGRYKDQAFGRDKFLTSEMAEHIDATLHEIRLNPI